MTKHDYNNAIDCAQYVISSWLRNSALPTTSLNKRITAIEIFLSTFYDTDRKTVALDLKGRKPL